MAKKAASYPRTCIGFWERRAESQSGQRMNEEVCLFVPHTLPEYPSMCTDTHRLIYSINFLKKWASKSACQSEWSTTSATDFTPQTAVRVSPLKTSRPLTSRKNLRRLYQWKAHTSHPLLCLLRQQYIRLFWTEDFKQGLLFICSEWTFVLDVKLYNFYFLMKHHAYQHIITVLVPNS